MGIIKYLKSTFAELKHVNWPTKKQALVYTVLIIVLSIVSAAYLGALDWAFTSLVKLFV